MARCVKGTRVCSRRPMRAIVSLDGFDHARMLWQRHDTAAPPTSRDSGLPADRSGRQRRQEQPRARYGACRRDAYMCFMSQKPSGRIGIQYSGDPDGTDFLCSIADEVCNRRSPPDMNDPSWSSVTATSPWSVLKRPTKLKRAQQGDVGGVRGRVRRARARFPMCAECCCAPQAKRRRYGRGHRRFAT